jgi:hypothetical protein
MVYEHVEGVNHGKSSTYGLFPVGMLNSIPECFVMFCPVNSERKYGFNINQHAQ